MIKEYKVLVVLIDNLCITKMFISSIKGKLVEN